MHKRKLHHVIAGGLLAALLALPAPAQAAGRTLGTVELWDWFEGLWGRGIAVLWAGGATQKLGHGIDPNGEKAGHGIDPNGEPEPAGAGIDPNGTTEPADLGIDPNGEA